MPSLKISDALSLPIEAVTRRMAILAMSGAGKSNTAVVLAEAMFDAGIPWVAIDPKGDWWGIRSSKNGKEPGLPIPIFGGLHGDVQIDPTAAGGKELADTIIQLRLTCVIDVSEFPDRQAMWAFLAAFGETLLRHNRQALHLFLEEADEYLPQSTREKGNLPKCLGVWQRVVKRGRFRGLGSTQISQRSAALNKDTLYMAEALIAMRATGKGDRDAIKGWVEYNNAANEIVASLPELSDGEGWLSSPAWLRETRRVKFLRRRTFDSGATPVLLDGKGSRPTTLADVDLSALEQKMSAAIEKAKAEDPKELRKKITDLQKQLAAKPAAVRSEPINKEQIEKRIQAAAETARDRTRAAISKSLAAACRDAVALQKSAEAMWLKLDALDTEVRDTTAYLAEPTIIQRPQKASPVPNTVRPERARPTTKQSSDLAPVEQRILDALAELGALGSPAPPRVQVAFLAGYSNLNSKGFTNAIGVLRSAGMIDYPNAGSISLTHEGCGRAGFAGTPRDADELQQRLLSLLDPVHARILKPLIKAYPDAIERERVAEAAGYTNLNSKGFTKSIGRLRSLGFIDYPQPGWIAAQPVLFMETGGGTNG